MNKLKILQVCNKIPYPPVEGGSIAMNSITQGLIKLGNSVHVLAMNTIKQGIDVNSLPEKYVSQVNLTTEVIDNRVKLLPAFINLFSNKSYHVERFISYKFQKKLEFLLTTYNYDIIHLETLYLTPYINTIRKYTKSPIVMRSHNVEHIIWERTAKNCKNILKKTYITHLAKKLKNYEINHLNDYDGIIAITENDKDIFVKLGCKIPITAIPVAFERHFDINRNIVSDRYCIFHLGSMNWMPNIEAVDWFLENVWDKLYNIKPSIKLCLAGKYMPERFFKINKPNVEIVGEVTNSHEFMLSKGIMIVPLFSGSGMRVKILEGMALGKTIISTNIGAEGINCKHNENIIIANTPDEFIKSILYCIENPDFCDNIGNNARKLVEFEYNLTNTTQKLIDFYNSLLRLNR